MIDVSPKDNSISRPQMADQPDAHGEAALLLVESVLHKPIERSVFSVSQAVELVDIAVEAKSEADDDLDTASVST